MIAGNEKTITRELGRFAEAGATDLLISPYGDTAELLALAASLR
ncbi:hypothetical protein BKA00_000453 [Actinomadura coerulea]|uniref:Uncharacterized protein n=1 Tax=Actinomadura coerulea TaxID=46159 RepID=A0A7X0FU20_9ACTN|nr:hypothetical protein [Actinomadura coerulea]MBB6393539.1 hypothetical protein [Actinomadura coerulea]GGP92143.1 hypothetical protein GCM10010187_04470 [Actinomadura coerulea]